MTDREMLELAAKAAGYVLDRHTQCDWKLCLGGSEWNPLTDDGDALRLRNKTSAMIADEGNCVFVGVYKYNLPSIEIREIYHCDTDNGCASAESIGASTRRAIVRAAAAIGEAMPCHEVLDFLRCRAMHIVRCFEKYYDARIEVAR